MIYFLNELIKDFNIRYSDGFILRIHHDNTINATDVICPYECKHPNVDFCNMMHKLYIPPKVWRFVPAGHPLVDIIMSRDLDSTLTALERVAVDDYISIPGGMWGFRPSLNRNLSRILHYKIHDQTLIKRFDGIYDQVFLRKHVWPFDRQSAVAHDTFLCKRDFGHISRPFPTQRPSAYETNCVVGCSRPYCGHGILSFEQCPIECRPKDHPEWLYC
ncbi:unnamed protein product [Rotaria sordida]|uniref:Uncharacterized protein n=1 Tax=Rotaria sordida TaxID=392033 RepID=A0A814FJQ0_9BILA|nr:unnamed protein product [Rotaria sordida]CAF0983918.1 unnamed protein product [Rotaria sordida]